MKLLFTSLLDNRNISVKVPFDNSLRLAYANSNSTWIPGRKMINYEILNNRSIILENQEAIYFKNNYAIGPNKLFLYQEIPSEPTSSFTISNQFPNIGDLVRFTDTSQENPTSWLWDFGDGTFDTEQNPTHIYLEPGNFTVSLKVTNLGGQSTSSNHIQVSSVVTHGTPVGIMLLITVDNG